jgi:hypothetical protein
MKDYKPIESFEEFNLKYGVNAQYSKGFIKWFMSKLGIAGLVLGKNIYVMQDDIAKDYIPSATLYHELKHVEQQNNTKFWYFKYLFCFPFFGGYRWKYEIEAYRESYRYYTSKDYSNIWGRDSLTDQIVDKAWCWQYLFMNIGYLFNKKEFRKKVVKYLQEEG